MSSNGPEVRWWQLRGPVPILGAQEGSWSKRLHPLGSGTSRCLGRGPRWRSAARPEPAVQGRAAETSRQGSCSPLGTQCIGPWLPGPHAPSKSPSRVLAASSEDDRVSWHRAQSSKAALRRVWVTRRERVAAGVSGPPPVPGRCRQRGVAPEQPPVPRVEWVTAALTQRPRRLGADPAGGLPVRVPSGVQLVLPVGPRPQGPPSLLAEQEASPRRQPRPESPGRWGQCGPVVWTLGGTAGSAHRTDFSSLWARTCPPGLGRLPRVSRRS